jgi:glycyl-tRNA synthetase beta chain
MVGEFPELQGVMGHYYALQDGEDPRIADAIADHYKPLGPNDTCPSAPESIAVALADKIDTLVGFYAIDEIPTGSRDPFALRRAALGIARIILENKVRLSLRSAFHCSFNTFGVGQLQNPAGPISHNVLTFIVDRLKIHLRERGVRPDLIAATVYRESLDHDDDLVRILARQTALASFLDSDDGANLLTAYKRAANIVRIEQGKDQTTYDPDDYRPLSDRPAGEIAVATKLNEAQGKVSELISHDRFEEAMAVLTKLRRPIDEFFEHVTVNVPEKELRENRLRLLARIRATMNQIADFSQIEG